MQSQKYKYNRANEPREDVDDDLRSPVTWDTLVQGMIEAGLVDMAEQLEELVSYL